MPSGADEILASLWARSGADEAQLATLDDATALLDAAYRSPRPGAFVVVAAMYDDFLVATSSLGEAPMARSITRAHIRHLVGENLFFEGDYMAAMLEFSSAASETENVCADQNAIALRVFYVVEALEAAAFHSFSMGDTRLAARAHDIELRLTLQWLHRWSTTLPALGRRLHGHVYYALSRVCLVRAVEATAKREPSWDIAARLWLLWAMALERRSEAVNPMWT